ncbi:AP-5 complex subunit mu-1 isoform X1 [Apteryx mantelli]|uniref:AP-5 complex subunit mu-1 n=1 Tax=Apteryx mantelli TaxID=2696672 RepID=A0ABM4EEU5_9AVES|nr:AP-5 complex subunit mu-1 isoform X1 [Apteryx rowi]
MALRALWLVRHDPAAGGAVLFSRRYPTVETRAKTFNGSTHVTVPDDNAFLKALLFELRLTDQNFVEYRDTCTRINKASVYAVRTEGGDLWPVLAFQKSGLIYVCLPLVEQALKPRPPLLSISGISQGLDLLSGILDFVSPSRKNEAELSAKIGQLRNLLLQACPLGTPLQTNLCSLNSSFDDIQDFSTNRDPKQPAWRTNTYKGKPHVNVCIAEKVKCMQYDKRDVVDMWQVYGTVTCKCDIEGAAPNVTLSLNLPTNGSPLQDILVHHCVTSLDSAMLMASSVDALDDSAFSGPYKFPFIPPSDSFNLCSYTSQVPVPPILGRYQLNEEGSQLKLTVNLKLHESIKNTFEYCEARIPFFNRGPIAHLEYKVSYGQLDLSREKSLLVWVIGQKFPKSLEISLTGTVTFGTLSEEHPTDIICTGNTAYVKLYFRIPDFTLTGCYVDQHSVQLFSPGKPKINASRELISSDYYIWNSKASAPIVYKTLFTNE